jgi:hypothetical protein
MTRSFSRRGPLICGIVAIFIAGCGGGSSSSNNNTTTPPPAISVTITNKITTIAAGAAAVTFNATVQNDSANAGVNWTITAGGANCQPTCGSLSGATTSSVTYTPPATVPASPNNAPTLVATSVTDSTKSDSDSFTITSGANNNSEVTGQYAFLIGGFDDASGNQFAYIGSISVNGQGAITGGVEDINLPGAAAQTAVVITGGSYTLGTDNRGTAIITTAAGSSTFAFSAGTMVSGVATKLHIIEFDDSTGTTGRRGSGEAYLQNSAAFSVDSLSGPFAFQLVGQDATVGSRTVEVGGFQIASGSVTSGTIDANDSFIGLSLNNAFTSTVSSTSDTTTAGRVTNVVTATVSGEVSDQVGYIVSSGQVLLMTTDSETSSGLLSGQALQQSTSSFTSANLTGTVIQYDSAVSTTTPNGYAEVGPMVFDGTGGAGTFNLEFINGSTPGELSGSFSSYTVSCTTTTPPCGYQNGHVTLSGATPLPDIWLVTTNEGFLMGTTNPTTSGASAAINSGFIEPQETGTTFSNSSISGNYFFGLPQYQPVTSGTVISGIATSTGNGTVNVTTDSSSSTGTLTTGQAQAVTLATSTLMGCSTSTGCFGDSGGGIDFVISATKFIRLIPSGTAPVLVVVEQ